MTARLFLLVVCVSVRAAPPPELASGLEHLKAQGSYSWEEINADPGPVAQRFETRRGKVTVVQQNTSPHVIGSIDRNGDTLIQRDWQDGLRLDTIITASGGVVTKTPDGWMTEQEILSALAEERLQAGNGTTPRLAWLRRADRPNLRRPDQELVPMLKSVSEFEAAGESYVTSSQIPPEVSGTGSAVDITLTINLRRGLIRDYEVKIEATRRVSRARVEVPISDQRIVILTYLPIAAIAIPEEAREKLPASVRP